MPIAIHPTTAFNTNQLLGVRNEVELLQPDRRFAVARRAIIAARRGRTARTDLGSVGDTTALVLAHREKALQEHAQVALDFANPVLMALLRRDIRPCSPQAIRPCAIGEKGDPGRQIPKP